MAETANRTTPLGRALARITRHDLGPGVGRIAEALRSSQRPAPACMSDAFCSAGCREHLLRVLPFRPKWRSLECGSSPARPSGGSGLGAETGLGQSEAPTSAGIAPISRTYCRLSPMIPRLGDLSAIETADRDPGHRANSPCGRRRRRSGNEATGRGPIERIDFVLVPPLLDLASNRHDILIRHGPSSWCPAVLATPDPPVEAPHDGPRWRKRSSADGGTLGGLRRGSIDHQRTLRASYTPQSKPTWRWHGVGWSGGCAGAHQISIAGAFGRASAAKESSR